MSHIKLNFISNQIFTYFSIYRICDCWWLTNNNNNKTTRKVNRVYQLRAPNCGGRTGSNQRPAYTHTNRKYMMSNACTLRILSEINVYENWWLSPRFWIIKQKKPLPLVDERWSRARHHRRKIRWYVSDQWRWWRYSREGNGGPMCVYLLNSMYT